MTETWRTQPLGVPTLNDQYGVDFYKTGAIVVDQEVLIELQDIAAIARSTIDDSCECSPASGTSTGRAR